MEENGILLRRAQDLCLRAQQQSVMLCTDFLTAGEAESVKNVARPYGDLQTVFFGGFSDCERKLLCICPSFLPFDPEMAPLVLFKIELKGQERPTHRDYLGSVLALGLKREKIGDILAGEGCGYLACKSEIAPFIQQNLESVGRNSVSRITRVNGDEVDVKREYEAITDTVPSARLDGVVASLLRTSRGKAQEVIQAKRVDVNHTCNTNNDHTLAAGDVISIRGCGRFIVDDISQNTRKGRIVLQARKFK